MNEPRKQILVIDDHPLIRKGLCDAIQAQDDLDVCAEAGCLTDAKAVLVDIQPDAIVLDLNLPDGNGWMLIEELSEKNHLPPTLVLSVNDESLYATRLLQAGARGYLMKDTPIKEILTGIRKILAGHIAVSDEIATRLIENQGGQELSEAQSMERLSNRELQVFEMIARGLGNQNIALQLGISAKTIGTYKARLMEKLNVRTTPQLIALAAGCMTGTQNI